MLTDPYPVASSCSPGVIIGHALEREEAPPVSAPARALHAYLPLGVELPVNSIAVPALGLEALVHCLENRALAPGTVCGCVDKSSLALTRHDRFLPMCGFVTPGRGLLTATGIVECARALRVTARGLDDGARDRLAVARPGVTAQQVPQPVTGPSPV